MPLQPSADLITFLTWWEGLPGGLPALVSYQDGAGVWTIGYGKTSYVVAGTKCSPDQAMQWLWDDANLFMGFVCENVQPNLEQCQVDALTSLAYNIGERAFAGSTMLAMINNGQVLDAASQFSRWVRSAGVVVPGLVNRRAAEQAIYVNGDYSARP